MLIDIIIIIVVFMRFIVVDILVMKSVVCCSETTDIKGDFCDQIKSFSLPNSI